VRDPQYCDRIFRYEPENTVHDKRITNQMGVRPGERIRSIAIIIAISKYGKLKTRDPQTGEYKSANLISGEADLQQLQHFFIDQLFDEIVVLSNENATRNNIDYFTGEYIANRFSYYDGHIRVAIAISSHGTPTTRTHGAGILLYDAKDPNDNANIYNLNELNTHIAELADPTNTFQVLVLLNSCYGGGIGNWQEAPGASATDPDKYGAHAITAGDVDALVYSNPDPSTGSIFYSSLIDGVEHDDNTADNIMAVFRKVDTRGKTIQSGYPYVRLLPLYKYIGDHFVALNWMRGGANQGVDSTIRAKYSSPKLFTLGKDSSEGAFFFLRPRFSLSPDTTTDVHAAVVSGHPDIKIFRAPETYRIKGIDVSSVNVAHAGGEKVFWPSVREAGVSFAYIRARAVHFWDPSFDEMWRDAKRAGLWVGAYFLMSYCETPPEQTERFTDFLHHVTSDQRSLPIAINIEWGAQIDNTGLDHTEKSCAAHLGNNEISDRVRMLVEEYQRQTGRIPVIYGNSDVFGRIIRGRIQESPYMIWYADYRITDDNVFHLYGSRPWALWQHSESGSVPGVRGPVDLDVFYGGPAEFDMFAEGRVDPVLSPIREP
jgi:lysozyme